MSQTNYTPDIESTTNELFATLASLVDRISRDRHIETMEAFELIRKILDGGCL